jgi:VanZ family protein
VVKRTLYDGQIFDISLPNCADLHITKTCTLQRAKQIQQIQPIQPFPTNSTLPNKFCIFAPDFSTPSMLLPPKNRLLLPFIWFLAITWLSTKGGVSLPGFSLIGTDKLAHAAAYALLSWLLAYAYQSRKFVILRNISVFSFVYGAFMEFVQYTFFPNRYFEVDDMLANGIGAILGVLVYRYTSKKLSKHTHTNQ